MVLAAYETAREGASQALDLTLGPMLDLSRERLVEVTQAEAFAPIYVRLAYTPS